jgi:hypothetical protein
VPSKSKREETSEPSETMQEEVSAPSEAARDEGSPPSERTRDEADGESFRLATRSSRSFSARIASGQGATWTATTVPLHLYLHRRGPGIIVRRLHGDRIAAFRSWVKEELDARVAVAAVSLHTALQRRFRFGGFFDFDHFEVSTSSVRLQCSFTLVKPHESTEKKRASALHLVRRHGQRLGRKPILELYGADERKHFDDLLSLRVDNQAGRVENVEELIFGHHWQVLHSQRRLTC